MESYQGKLDEARGLLNHQRQKLVDATLLKIGYIEELKRHQEEKEIVEDQIAHLLDLKKDNTLDLSGAFDQMDRDIGLEDEEHIEVKLWDFCNLAELETWRRLAFCSL